MNTLDLDLPASLGVQTCRRCGLPVDPTAYNSYRVRGKRDSRAKWCRPCVLKFAQEQVCLYLYGITHTQKREMWEEQGRCCAICKHAITFERPDPAGRGAHRLKHLRVAATYSPWFAILDHKKGPTSLIKQRHASTGRIKTTRRFHPDDMVRAILCECCNDAVGSWDRWGYELTSQPVKDYVAYWNEIYSRRRIIGVQTQLFHGFDFIQEAA